MVSDGFDVLQDRFCIPGEPGIRHEDTVAVTESGCENLAPKWSGDAPKSRRSYSLGLFPRDCWTPRERHPKRTCSVRSACDNRASPKTTWKGWAMNGVLQWLRQHLCQPPGAPAIAGQFGRARIAVLAFTETEIATAKRVFQAEHDIPRTPAFSRAPSDSSNYALVVLKSDQWIKGAMGSTRQVIWHFKPTFVLTIGTAGTRKPKPRASPTQIDHDPELGDVVVGDFVDYIETRKLVSEERRRRYEPIEHPSYYLRCCIAEKLKRGPWHAGLNGYCERPAEFDRLTGGPPDVHVGNIVSGEKILSDHTSNEQQAILKDFDKALAFDTESHGVGYAIFLARGEVHFDFHYNPLFLPIRAISDYVDHEDSNRIRQLWTPYATAAASAFACAIAERLLTEVPSAGGGGMS